MYYHGEDFRSPTTAATTCLAATRCSTRARSRATTSSTSAIAHGLASATRSTAWSRASSGQAPRSSCCKRLGKKIVYSNSGCLDGVLQSTFDAWGPEPTCEICPWRDAPRSAATRRNRAWGEFRNSLADYQVHHGRQPRRLQRRPDACTRCPSSTASTPTSGGPTSRVPAKLPASVSGRRRRSSTTPSATRGTRRRRGAPEPQVDAHLLPADRAAQGGGHDRRAVYFTDVPNRDVRYYQVQADVVCDMLTFGWFGANVREAMMLGKPAICFLRPAWLESVRGRASRSTSRSCRW